MKEYEHKLNEVFLVNVTVDEITATAFLGELTNPVFGIVFIGTIDVPLVKGGIYFCGKNSFIALSSHKITLVNTHVERFNIPKHLELIRLPDGKHDEIYKQIHKSPPTPLHETGKSREYFVKRD